MRLVEPLGFFAFVHLEKQAACVLTHKGRVQEECCILKIPAVTLRDVTERPETIEVGSNILSGAAPEQIVAATAVAISAAGDWDPPPEYLARSVAQTVRGIILGYRHTLGEPYFGGQ